MRLRFVSDNPIERLAMALGGFPPGLFESWFGFMLSRAFMAATRLGVFEALGAGPLTREEVAGRCRTSPQATGKLLNALAGVGCLRARGDRYALVPAMRRWMLEESPDSFRDQVLLHFLEGEWWAHCEEYVRTGEPLRVHRTMSDEDWRTYQRGMRSGIGFPARWVARHLPLPRTARDMLDIGGSHGYFSVALCRRYPKLRSTVLDLPQAIPHAAPLLAREGMGDRVVHRAGDALTDELGVGAYDLVFMAALAHHFDAEANQELARRIARALRPGGIAAIWEPVRQDGSGKVRQIGGLLDLYFGLFSEAGTWSVKEITGWHRAAGLVSLKPKRMGMGPDLALFLGRKPR